MSSSSLQSSSTSLHALETVLVGGIQYEIEVPCNHPRVGDGRADRSELREELNFVRIRLRPVNAGKAPGFRAITRLQQDGNRESPHVH